MAAISPLFVVATVAMCLSGAVASAPCLGLEEACVQQRGFQDADMEAAAIHVSLLQTDRRLISSRTIVQSAARQSPAAVAQLGRNWTELVEAKLSAESGRNATAELFLATADQEKPFVDSGRSGTAEPSVAIAEANRTELPSASLAQEWEAALSAGPLRSNAGAASQPWWQRHLTFGEPLLPREEWEASLVTARDHPAGSQSGVQGILKVAVGGLFVGGIFGMMGAGGSLILKPLLYYGFAVVPFKHAIFNTYVIVMCLAAVGVVRGNSKGLVIWHDVPLLVLFTSIIGASVGSYLASLVLSTVQLLTFGTLILLVATYMVWPSKDVPQATEKEDMDSAGTSDIFAKMITSAVAITVGILSGFTGVGGGFMLTPLLCHLGHDMDTAVPTSQAIICMSSVLALSWYAFLNGYGPQTIEVVLVVSVTLFGIVGLMCSDRLAALMSKLARQRFFALLLLLIGSYIVLTAPPVSGRIAAAFGS